MVNERDGETWQPAFPVFPETGNAHAAAFRGMSLRDWFAGQALIGLIGSWPSGSFIVAEVAADVAVMKARADVALGRR